MNDRKQNYIRIAVIVIMCLFCVLKPSGISILIAILYLAVDKRLSKKSSEDLGLKHRALFDDIKKYWWLIILPTVCGLVAIGLSKVLLPEFYQHVLERTQPMLSLNTMHILIIQLLVRAFGEELAFRAFLQDNISPIKTVFRNCNRIAIFCNSSLFCRSDSGCFL